jgi:hypothetical protein
MELTGVEDGIAEGRAAGTVMGEVRSPVLLKSPSVMVYVMVRVGYAVTFIIYLVCV